MNVFVARAIAKHANVSENLVYGLADAVPLDITFVDFIRLCTQENQGR